MHFKGNKKVQFEFGAASSGAAAATGVNDHDQQSLQTPVRDYIF